MEQVLISLATSVDRNPRKQAMAMPIRSLVSLLKELDKAYHIDSNPLATDNQYDILRDVLAERDPTNPYLSKTGHSIKRSRKKVTLPVYMPSLDKIKPDGKINQWTAKYTGPYVVSDKMDGQSLLLVYNNTPVAAYTRGDGKVGQDVSHLLPNLKIPRNIKKQMTVRCEFLMSRDKFKQFDKALGGEFDNARNMTGGIVNSLKDSDHTKHVTIMAYKILDGYGANLRPSKQLTLLKTLGFNVVPHTVITEADDEVLSKLWNKRKARSKYDIDGIVVENDTVNKQPRAGYPSYMFAYKINTLEATKEVVVESIEWEATKTGKLFPTIRITPTRIGGVTITNVTGHSAFFIINGFRQKDSKNNLPVRPIGPGAVLAVVRSGDVIPHVVSVIKPARKPGLPDVPHTIKDGNAWLTKGSDQDEDVKVRRMLHFFTTLKIDGAKEQTVRKLRAIGIKTISRVFNTSVEELLKVEGFKEKSAVALYNSIQKAKQSITFARLGDASGLFGDGIGERRLQDLIQQIPDILQLDLSTSDLVERIRQVHGFEVKTARKIAIGLPKFVKLLDSLGLKLTKTKKSSTGPLQNMVVLFSSVRDKELVEIIEKNGGTVVGSFSSKVNTLIIKDEFATSSKITKARENNVKIYTLDKFYQFLDKRGIK